MIDIVNLLDELPRWLYNADYQQSWIPLVIAGVSLAAQAFGSAKSANARKSYNRQLQAKRDSLSMQMDNELRQDYLDTDVAKSSLRKLSNMYSDNMRRIEGNGAKRGLTDEAKVTAANGMNRTFADAVSSIAAQGTAYKENKKRYYQGKIDSLDGMLYNNQVADSEKWQQFGSNVANTAGALLSAYGEGAFSKAAPGSAVTTDIAKVQSNATMAPISSLDASAVGKLAPTKTMNKINWGR